MATTPLTINIVAGTLPPGAVYNAQTYFAAIVARMTATVSAGNVLWGQLGGGQPTGALAGVATQAGLWFGNPFGGSGYWNDWNSTASTYMPAAVVCGQYVSGAVRITTIACGATSANQTITTPNATGTIALTSQLARTTGTTITTGGASITIDWSNPVPLYITMTGNMTLNSVNTADGVLMDLWLVNSSGLSSTTYTISAPGVFWPNAAGPPALSPGVAGKRVIDHIRLHQANGLMFGQLLASNYQV